MLSAVENLAPGRVYSHPFSGPVAPSLLAQLPIPSGLPYITDMSVAEFARPHPKQRYPDTLARNGLLSSRSKYSDQQQNGPVNLAVSTSSTHSVKTNHMVHDYHGSSLQHQQHKEAELGKLYTPNSRLQSFFSSPALEANTYQTALNYSLYGNPFGYFASRSTGLYPPHYPRSTYIPPNQREPYNPSSYLPPVSFASPEVTNGNVASNKSKLALSSSLHSHLNGQHSGHNGVPPSMPPIPQEKHTEQIAKPMLSFADRSYLNGNSHLVSEHLHPPYPNFPKEKENKLEKHHLQQPHPESNKGFKIPSGKEGSLKHRILTRPYSEKDGRRKSPTTKTSTTIFKSSDNGTTTNFTKGSLIELANGEYRRVEDVRTEDFVLLAEKSVELQLTESTTVKITPRYNNVVITFSYDNNKSKIDIEASIEHPFFVYGQGWASCNPEKTLQLFGLKCQRLQVGDICLSLKPREQRRAPASYPPSNTTSLQLQQIYEQIEKNKELFQNTPQNLSRRPSQTIVTTATSTAVSSRTAPPVNLPVAPVFSIPFSMPTSKSNPSSSHNNNDQPVAMVVDKSSYNDDSLDSALSRKRRWSAPDNICDDEQPNNKTFIH